MLTDITVFTYIRPIKFNAQIINGRKDPAKGFVLVIIKIPQKNIVISLWSSYHGSMEIMKDTTESFTKW